MRSRSLFHLRSLTAAVLAALTVVTPVGAAEPAVANAQAIVDLELREVTFSLSQQAYVTALDALNDARRLPAIGPRKDESTLTHAGLYQTLGLPAEAERTLRELSAKKVAVPERAWLNLARLLLQRDRLRETEQALSNLRDLPPGTAQQRAVKAPHRRGRGGRRGWQPAGRIAAPRRKRRQGAQLVSRADRAARASRQRLCDKQPGQSRIPGKLQKLSRSAVHAGHIAGGRQRHRRLVEPHQCSTPPARRAPRRDHGAQQAARRIRRVRRGAALQRRIRARRARRQRRGACHHQTETPAVPAAPHRAAFGQSARLHHRPSGTRR